MDLDDDLRRMFAEIDDDRLDVPVRPGAEQAIVAGARRVRRRRIMTVTASGAAAVAVLVVGGVLLSAMRPEASPPVADRSDPPSVAQSDDTVSSSPATSSAGPSSASQSMAPPPETNNEGPTSTRFEDEPPVTGEQIGPTGFQDVRLGMSYDEVLATGAINEPPAAEPGCMQYTLLAGGYVYITDTRGVEAIGPELGLHTPEGASTGWTIEQVKAVYPDMNVDNIADHGRTYVTVPGNESAVYRLEFSGSNLVSISLQLDDQTCYE